MRLRDSKGMPLVIVLAGVTVAFTGCPWYWLSEDYTADPVTETRALNSGGRLEVTNDVGAISIAGWDNNEVRITYEKQVTLPAVPRHDLEEPAHYLDLITVEITGDETAIAVAADLPITWPLNVSGRVNFDILVPRQVLLDLENNVGSVSMEGVQGAVSAVVNVGNVVVEHAALLDSSESIACEVDVGDIGVALASDSAFSLDAATALGDISVDAVFDLPVTRVGLVGAAASGTVGAGGAAIDLQVATGNIHVGAL